MSEILSGILGWPDTLTLIDLFVLGGVAIVLPLALPSRGWWGAAPATGLALLRPEGWSAAVLVLPWLAVALSLVGVAIGRSDAGYERLAGLVAPAYAAVAALGMLQSRLGVELLGVREPIVELTAVHFTYAGAAAMTLARFQAAAQPGRPAAAAVVVTAAAPPVVALGFVTDSSLLKVGGAVLMTIGVWLIAVLQLRSAARRGTPLAVRGLLAASGLAVWIPMPLALAWAAAQRWDVPALSITDMARVHGSLNAVGFILCGLIAWRKEVVA